MPAVGEATDLMRLPLEATVQAIATLGRPLDEFDGFRIVVRDPPMACPCGQPATARRYRSRAMSESKVTSESVTEFADVYKQYTPVALALARALRAALLPGASAAGVRRLALRYGVNRTLMSHFLRVADSQDPSVVMSLLPGPRACDSLVRSLAEARSDPAAVEAFREAHQAYRAFFDSRGIDSAMRQAIAAGRVDSAGGRRQLVKGRRMVFEGSTLIYGCRIGTKVCSFLMAPSASPGLVDTAVVTLFDQVEVLCPGLPKMLFAPLIASKDDEDWVRIGDAGQRHPVFPGLVPELSTAGIAERGAIEFVHDRSRTAGAVYLSHRGSLSGPFHLTFLERARGLGSIRAGKPGETATVHSQTLVPMRSTVLEVWVHRDVHGWGSPEAMAVDTVTPLSWSQPPRLPLECDAVPVPDAEPLAGLEARRATYLEAIAAAATGLGHVPADFRCIRVTVPFPTVRSAILLRWALAE